MSAPTRFQVYLERQKLQPFVAQADFTPTGDMRERIAAALYHARPSFRIDKALDKSYAVFLLANAGQRDLHQEWADDLLTALDHLGLEIVDRDRQ